MKTYLGNLAVALQAVYKEGIDPEALYVGNTLLWSKSDFAIESVFADGQQGALYEPWDLSTLWQDAAGTVPVTANGDPVGLMRDKSGNNNHATQTVSAARATYKTSPDRLSLDKVDDAIVINMPSRLVGTMTLASTTGTATYGVDIPAGNFTLGGAYFPSTNIVGLVLREGVLSSSDEGKVDNYLVDKGAVKSFSGVTNMNNYWRGWDKMTTFPVMDTSNTLQLESTWFDCKSLTAFPLLDFTNAISLASAWRNCTNLSSLPVFNTPNVTSVFASWLGCAALTVFPALNFSKVTNIGFAWTNCTSLSDFPSGMFDNVKTGNFSSAFNNTKLSQSSIDSILVSLVASGIASGTRVFDQSGGSAPSATGRAAIDTLRARGWAVTVTGGY